LHCGQAHLPFYKVKLDNQGLKLVRELWVRKIGKGCKKWSFPNSCFGNFPKFEAISISFDIELGSNTFDILLFPHESMTPAYDNLLFIV
jgi:hypothetical protein